MLTLEQKKMIKECYDSRDGFGIDAPIWFTCRCMLVTSGIKELPFEEVFGYINTLDMEYMQKWCNQQTYLAQKKEEEKKKNESKHSRNVSEKVSGDSSRDATKGN